eukprot:m.21370 g.21370  ORF g.21370 m.21370 type:complete len:520 (-) comp12402_c0_seq1:24-1583(-)
MLIITSVFRTKSIFRMMSAQRTRSKYFQRGGEDAAAACDDQDIVAIRVTRSLQRKELFPNTSDVSQKPYSAMARKYGKNQASSAPDNKNTSVQLAHGSKRVKLESVKESDLISRPAVSSKRRSSPRQASATSKPTKAYRRSGKETNPKISDALTSPKRSPTKKALPKSTPPHDFNEVWDIVEIFRSYQDAPVDMYGAEALGLWRPDATMEPYTEDEYSFAIFVALLLSSQTKDEVVAASVHALKTRAYEQKQRFTAAFILQLGPVNLDQLIGKVGFHNNKTKYLLGACTLLMDPSFAPDAGGSGSSRPIGTVPHSAEELLRLPGIGPKMAYLIAQIAFKDEGCGIGVDTHMHRIFRDLRWTTPEQHAKGPEMTRVVVESWLPSVLWPTVNLLFVGFGQQAQQFRIKLLKRCCGVPEPRGAKSLDTATFPEEKSVAALKLLVRCGGVHTAPGKEYVTRAVERETGQTPLMWAAASGWAPAVEYLIQVGCSRSATCRQQKTAADYAQSNGHTTIVQLLKGS